MAVMGLKIGLEAFPHYEKAIHNGFLLTHCGQSPRTSSLTFPVPHCNLIGFSLQVEEK
jgi:hypothetical protein